MFKKLKDGCLSLWYNIKGIRGNTFEYNKGFWLITGSALVIFSLLSLQFSLDYASSYKTVKEMVPFNTTVSLEGSKDFDKAVNYVLSKTLFKSNAKNVNYVVFADIVNNYGIIKLPKGKSFYDDVKNNDRFEVLYKVQYRITDKKYPITSTGIESELPDTVIIGDVGRESERGKYLPLTDYDHKQLKSMGIFLDEGYVYAKLSAGAETSYRAYYRSGDAEYLKDFMNTLPKHWYGVTDHYHY